MGGRVWSDREERYFWRKAMPRSPKRVGADRAKTEKAWSELAPIMQRELGEYARRQYTGTMLFEHYFQNIETQRVSPNATLYVREYLRKSGSFNSNHPFLRGPRSMGRGIRPSTGSVNTRDGGHTTGHARSQRSRPVPDDSSSRQLLTEGFLESSKSAKHQDHRYQGDEEDED
ncbi:hypothetical protein JX266_013940 [Neoarthrinium moseri]|nr:hypothetical protein JX266_013940 [Neoarthrinium moseri]